MKINRRLIGTAAALCLGLLPTLDAAPARAIGCFTGGAAGAVAGHYAGHHAVVISSANWLENQCDANGSPPPA